MPVIQLPGGQGFKAVTANGTVLGIFPSRASAQAALDRHNKKKRKK